MNLEQKIKLLEEISDKMDDDSLSIDKGIELFEQGLKITKDCVKELSEAKEKIVILKKDLDKILEEPFN